MRALGPVVLALALEVLRAEAQLPGRGTLGPQPVSHQHLRRHAVLLQKLILTVLVIDRFGPVSGGDGSDLARYGAEPVPGVAAGGDDGVVGLEDAGVEKVVLEELPQVLDRVELGAVGRQRQERDVVGHAQRPGAMPAGLVEDDHGVGIRGHLGGDLGQVQVHRRGVDIGQDERRGALACRAHRGEEVGGGVPLVLGLPRPAATARPLPGQLALLADPALVLEPDLEPPARTLVADGSGDPVGKFF